MPLLAEVDLGGLDSSIDQPFTPCHCVEKELLEREASKTRIFDKPARLRAKIILREMRKCPMAETEGNATTLHTLLPHTNRHLGYVDERTLGASNHHLFDIIVFFQVFLRILTGLITSHVQLALIRPQILYAQAALILQFYSVLLGFTRQNRPRLSATIIQDVPTLLRLRFALIIRNGLSHIV